MIFTIAALLALAPENLHCSFLDDVLAETTHGAKVRHLGQRRCRVHGLLRQGAREQGRHGAAAAPAAQPQRPGGGAHDESPSAVVVEAGDRGRPPRPRAAVVEAAPRAEPPPANGEQQQRGVRPGWRRPPEQVRAAAAVLPTREPAAAAAAPSSPWRPPLSPRRPPPAAPAPVRARAPSPARAQGAPRGAWSPGPVRLAAKQRSGES
jgi:hypothetical protein